MQNSIHAGLFYRNSLAEYATDLYQQCIGHPKLI